MKRLNYHPPGPWRVDEPEQDIDAQGRLQWWEATKDTPRRPVMIAEISGLDSYGHSRIAEVDVEYHSGKLEGVAKDTAELLSLAPTMYEALWQIAQDIQRGDHRLDRMSIGLISQVFGLDMGLQEAKERGSWLEVSGIGEVMDFLRIADNLERVQYPTAESALFDLDEWFPALTAKRRRVEWQLKEEHKDSEYVPNTIPITRYWWEFNKWDFDKFVWMRFRNDRDRYDKYAEWRKKQKEGDKEVVKEEKDESRHIEFEDEPGDW